MCMKPKQYANRFDFECEKGLLALFKIPLSLNTQIQCTVPCTYHLIPLHCIRHQTPHNDSQLKNWKFNYIRNDSVGRCFATHSHMRAYRNENQIKIKMKRNKVMILKCNKFGSAHHQFSNRNFTILECKRLCKPSN